MLVFVREELKLNIVKSIYHHGICYINNIVCLVYSILYQGLGLCIYAWKSGVYCSLLVMMTSWNGSIFRVTCTLWGKSTGDFPSQRPVTRSFDVFFDLRTSKRLSKQSRRWWFETPSRSLWRHSNVFLCTAYVPAVCCNIRLTRWWQGNCNPNYVYIHINWTYM